MDVMVIMIMVMVIIVVVLIVMVLMVLMVLMVTQLSMFDSLLPVGSTSMTKMMGIRRSAAHQDSGRVTTRI